MAIKETLKDKLPSFILDPLLKIHLKYLKHQELVSIRKQPALHAEALAKVKEKKGPVNVVFLALFDSVWKYDDVYRIMRDDPRFNPVILVCPVVNYSRENMLSNMNNCYNLFKSRGYDVVKSYDEAADTYVDLRNDLKPDIIMYTNPYPGLIDNRYFIHNFPDILTIYVNYYYDQSTNLPVACDLLLHNLVWKRYCENQDLLDDCRRVMRNKGRNAVYTGFPGTDSFIEKGVTRKDVWKIKDRNVKRIIWAPHHTISDYTSVNYSTFLTYYDFMFELADKYRDSIQICFKPHPLLKNRLVMEWGEDKTREYYSKWENLPNGMLNDSAYEDLFMTSDAIIHDCGSFIAEYLYTKNPSMYLTNGLSFKQQYNRFAIKCLDNYYIGRSKEDVETFVKNLISGTDPMKEDRHKFVNGQLMPPNGKLASENIVDDIVRELGI